MKVPSAVVALQVALYRKRLAGQESWRGDGTHCAAVKKLYPPVPLHDHQRDTLLATV